MLALVLGLIVSAGLYFAYLWPSVEPSDDEEDVAVASAGEPAPRLADSRLPDAALSTEEQAPS